jgi:hypothetical protein
MHNKWLQIVSRRQLLESSNGIESGDRASNADATRLRSSNSQPPRPNETSSTLEAIFS